MEKEVITVLSQAGTSGIVALIVIVYMYFDSKKKRDNLVVKDDQRSDKTEEVATELRQENTKENERIAILETIFSEHCKTQTESMATLHNGLNSNANAVKDLAKGLNDYNTRLEVLTALFNERLPKK